MPVLRYPVKLPEFPLCHACVVASRPGLSSCSRWPAGSIPTRPVPESEVSTAQGPATKAAQEAQINGLIDALYAPQEQGAVKSQFARIKARWRATTAEAQTSIVTFVQTLLADLENGDLEDPNGAQPPSTADALASLVNAVAQFGGLPAPIPPSNPLGGDGAVAVVGPAGGTVVTASGFGGVQFPAGALPANVIVVVNRLPNPVTPTTGPLPTTFDQYPLFYEFSTTPPVAQFAQDVMVGICQLEVGEPFGPPTQTVASRLQLAHPNPAAPTTVELLAREPAPFLSCAGVVLAEARERRQGEGVLANAFHVIKGLGTRAVAVFRPTPLYAVHGGLGGKTKSFSPFAAVDPGIQIVGVCGTPMSGVSQTYATVDVAMAGVLPGGIIKLCPQTIVVPGAFVMPNKSLTIEAEIPSNKPQFIVNGPGIQWAFVHLGAPDLVVFRNLSFTLTGGAIGAIDIGLVGNSPTPWKEVLVENSVFNLQSGAGRAVRVFSSTRPNPKVTIQGNQMSGGVFPIVTLSGSATSTIEVLSNSFTGMVGIAGALIQSEANVLVDGNTFSGGGCGFQGGCISLFSVANALVQNNTMTLGPPLQTGIKFTLSSGTITQNSITGVGGGGPPSAEASYATPFGGIVITPPTQTDANGISSSTVSVTQNTVTNAVAGLRVVGGGSAVTGSNNVFSNVHSALRLDNTSASPSSLVMNLSDFTTYFRPISFLGAGISPNTINGTCNWWGSAAGPQNLMPGTPSTIYSPWATGPIANGAGGLCAGTIPTLSAINCSQESSLQSLNSSTPTTVEFINASPQTIRIYWQNFAGQRVLYNTLVPGQAYVQPTFVTHPWVATNTSDQCVAIYQPAASHSRAIVP